MTYIDFLIICCVLMQSYFVGKRLDVIRRDLQEQSNQTVEIKTIEVRLKITDADGYEVLSSLHYAAPEIQMDRIQKWLDARNLVMTPKGKDFKVAR